MARFVGYDRFTTMRIRYIGGGYEDISILSDDSDKWWNDETKWDGYIMNMLAEVRSQDSKLLENFESIMIIMPDWGEDRALIHEFTVFNDGDNNTYHKIHEICE